MKYIAIIFLVVLGIYLYKRTKRLAEDEQEQASLPAEKEIFNASKANDILDTDVDSKVEKRVTEEQVTAEGINKNVDKTESEVVEMTESLDEGLSFDTKETPRVKDLAEPELATPEAEGTLAGEPAETESNITMVAFTDETWANEKLTVALSEYRSASDNTIKHTGLLDAISECYKQRKQTQYREYGVALLPYYLSLFAVLEPSSSHKGLGFMHLSTLLNDCGEFDSAIDVCRKAIEYGLNDGTVTGFEGRITRIEKAKAKSLK
ncbi:MAG: hypothetical protein V5788_09745 [Shewanella sp.]